MSYQNSIQKDADQSENSATQASQDAPLGSYYQIRPPLSEIVIKPDDLAQATAVYWNRQSNLFADLRMAGAILQNHDKGRTFNCLLHAVMFAEQNVKFSRREDTNGFLTAKTVNYKVCGRLWSCPYCARSISLYRMREVRHVIRTMLEQGFHAYMFTFTIPHTRHDYLAWLIDVLYGSTGKLARERGVIQNAFKHRNFQEVFKLRGHFHSITNKEVTWGATNGWHPHSHAVHFFREPLTDTDIQRMRDAYAQAVKTATTRNINQHGFDCRPFDNHRDYLAKHGLSSVELAGHGFKDPNHKHGSNNEPRLDPFKFLAMARSGDRMAESLFLEFSLALFGRRQLQFTNGLKKFVGLDEFTDIQAIQMAEESEARTTMLEHYLVDREFYLTFVKAGMESDLRQAIATSGDATYPSFIRLLEEPK